MNEEEVGQASQYRPPKYVSLNDEEVPEGTAPIQSNPIEAFSQIKSENESRSAGQLSSSSSSNKIGRKVSYLTNVRSSSDKNRQRVGEKAVCFDGISVGLVGQMSLFMEDNFTAYIVRGMQTRNIDAGVVSILANPTIQKCKTMLQRLRIECFILLLAFSAFLLTEFIMCVISFFSSSSSGVIISQIAHVAVASASTWSFFQAARYFIPQKSQVALGLCIIMILIMIAEIVFETTSANTLPNSFSVLFLIQISLFGGLFHAHQQINRINKIFR